MYKICHFQPCQGTCRPKSLTCPYKYKDITHATRVLHIYADIPLLKHKLVVSWILGPSSHTPAGRRRREGGAQEHLKSSEDLERDLEPHFTLEEEEEGERRGAPTEPWLVKWHSHFFFSFSPSYLLVDSKMQVQQPSSSQMQTLRTTYGEVSPGPKLPLQQPSQPFTKTGGSNLYYENHCEKCESIST